MAADRESGPHSLMLYRLLTLSLLTGKRLGQRLKYAYMRSQGHESQTMSPREDDTWRRIMAPAFPLLKFAASLGFPGFAVEMRTESDSGIQAYYDIFGSKAMPSGLIKLDMAPSNPLVKDLYTESGRAQLEAYVATSSGTRAPFSVISRLEVIGLAHT